MFQRHNPIFTSSCFIPIFCLTLPYTNQDSDMRTYSQIRQELKERMERAFAVCDRQIQRIEEALSDLGMTMPMSVEDTPI